MKKTNAVRIGFQDQKQLVPALAALLEHGLAVEAGAMMTHGSVTHAEFLLTDTNPDDATPPWDRAQKALTATGLPYEQIPAVVVRLADEPQSMAMLLGRLSGEALMESMYAIDFTGGTVGIAIGTKRPERVAELLADLDKPAS